MAVISSVVEIKQLRDISSAITNDVLTLLLLDLDETLIVSSCILNSSPWWTDIFNKFLGSSLPEMKSKVVLQCILDKVLQRIPFKAIELDAPQFLDQLQHRGVPILLNTARALSTEFVPASDTFTYQHLAQAGIRISEDALYKTLKYDASIMPHNFQRGNIIFAGEKGQKARSIMAVLDKCPVKPCRIVMVDDRLAELTEMQHELFTRQITFIGFHYTFWTPFLQLYGDVERMIAEVQLRSLLEDGRVLSDEDARQQLSRYDYFQSYNSQNRTGPPSAHFFLDRVINQLHDVDPAVLTSTWK